MPRYSSFKMKKSYSLLLTLFLILIFSFLGVFIINTKSFSINNNNNSYLQAQGKLHLIFLKNYIKSIDLKKECFENLDMNIDNYKLKANLNYEKSCINSEINKITVDIFVNKKSKFNEINLHEKFYLEI